MRERSHRGGGIQAEPTTGHPAGLDRQAGAQPQLLGARYLTDGAHLYRNLGPLDGAHGMIGLEDCMSLDLMLVTSDELQGGDMRAVDVVDAHEIVIAEGGNRVS
jgi:hypothetical protein